MSFFFFCFIVLLYEASKRTFPSKKKTQDKYTQLIIIIIIRCYVYRIRVKSELIIKVQLNQLVVNACLYLTYEVFIKHFSSFISSFILHPREKEKIERCYSIHRHHPTHIINKYRKKKKIIVYNNTYINTFFIFSSEEQCIFMI